MHKKILILFCVTVLTGCSNTDDQKKQNNILPDKQDIVFAARFAFKDPRNNTRTQYGEDTLLASIDHTGYMITPGGRLSWGNNVSDTVQLPTYLLIEDAYLYRKQQTLWVFYTETDNEAATSGVTKIDMTTRKKLWNTTVEGFNLGTPYISGNTAYVTALGFAGKISLGDGNYIYRISDLYDRERSAFNGFDTILFRDSLTLFLSKSDIYKRTDTVIVNERTHRAVVRK